ncbi:hypothetical protein NE237_009334 [Protea cynaroides]|uniref:Transmembrane protein n=1 Tax=Protea cynaroides TaxID=273540 RepID=A0A9Q0R0J3_9MAGN|nr:hypothetical protein NE237_009334 [Protea cynaroides]
MTSISLKREREREREREERERLSARFVMSPSMAPRDEQQGQADEVLLSGDKNFAAHGKALMLVLVILFGLFHFSLLFFYYLRWRRNPQPVLEDTENDNPSLKGDLCSVFKETENPKT